MRKRIVVIAGLVLSACLVPAEEPLGSARGDSGVDPERCLTTYMGISACAPLADPRVCGDVLCAAGTQCCLTTGQCTASCEAIDGGNFGGGDYGKPCALASDCAPDEYCLGEPESCFGPGRCSRIESCGVCGDDTSDLCAVCGCDGKTYATPQAACAAGVRTRRGACNDALHPTGVCVNQSQCGSEAFCCELRGSAPSGKCVRNDEAWRCQLLPDGGPPYTCRTDTDCRVTQSDYPWYTPPASACASDGCTGFGYCRVIGDTAGCSGVQRPVCGCDGQQYINACWAHGAATGVAHEGTCL